MTDNIPLIRISQLQEETSSSLPPDPRNTWFVILNAETMKARRVSFDTLLQYLSELFQAAGNYFVLNTAGGITVNGMTNKTVYLGNTISISDNTTISIARSSYDTANLAYSTANGAYSRANISFVNGMSSYNHGNSAYNNANSAYDKANAAYTLANFANSQISTNFAITQSAAISAYQHANSAYRTANSAYDQANSAYEHANSAYRTANSAYRTANSAYDHANSSYRTANSAYNQANSSYMHSNSSYRTANSSYNHANSAFAKANAAYDLAQSIFGDIPDIGPLANNLRYSWNQANSAHITANAVYNKANSAYDLASGIGAKYDKSGGLITGNVDVSGTILSANNKVEAFPTGTTLCFYQTSAPPGWSQLALSNYMLRVVSGVGGGSGGKDDPTVNNTMPAHTHSFSTDNQGTHGHSISISAGGDHAHSLTTDQQGWHGHHFEGATGGENANHTHAFQEQGMVQVGTCGGGGLLAFYPQTKGGTTSGISNGHAHGFAGDTAGSGAHAHNGSTNSAGNHSHSGSAAAGGGHTHSGTTNSTGSSGGWQPRYVDIIICKKV